MTVTSNNSGVPIYHYSKRLTEYNTTRPSGTPIMNRKVRRKLEKKIKKINKGAYLEYEKR